MFYKWFCFPYSISNHCVTIPTGGLFVSRPLHLTTGPILPQLMGLALPLLGANVLQQLYNIVNSLVVTWYLGEQALAALGIAESVMNLYIYVITGACMGSGVLVAQFYGEQNLSRLRRQLYVSAVLIGGSVLAAVLLGQLFLPQILTLIQTPDEVRTDVSAYLRIILAGMVFTFAYNYLAAALRSIGDTRVALYILFLSLGYNLLAAWLLVSVLKLGIVGTALATASAQLLSAALCLLYIRSKRAILLFGKADMVLEPALIRLTISYCAVAALQQSSLYLGKLVIQGAVNGISAVSTAAISAFTAAGRVENFTQAFGLSGCEAMAIFIAQNHGAGEDRRALRGFLLGSAVTVGVGVVFSAAMGLFAQPLAHLFLGGGEGMAPCISYLRLISWFYLLSFFGNSFVGWFRGTGRMNITFFGTTLQIVIRVVGTYLLVGTMGLDAVALATGLGWVAIVLFQTTIFLRQIRPNRPSAPPLAG